LFRQFHEVKVGSYQCVDIFFARPLKDLRVGGASQTVVIHAFQGWENIAREAFQSGGQVLIEKNPHV